MKTWRVDMYYKLISALVERKISIEEFKISFLKDFREERSGPDKEGRLEPDKIEFQILEDVFESLDTYSPGSEHDVLPYRITEATFRKEIEVALDQLERHLQQKNRQ